jgi:hypothetical protein
MKFRPHGSVKTKWEDPLLWVYSQDAINLEAVEEVFEEILCFLDSYRGSKYVEIQLLGPGSLLTPEAEKE